MKELFAGVFLWCSSFSLPAVAQDYPDTWWAPIPREQAASWEVLPQDADRSKNEVILSKRNELGLLSNFAATPFTFEGKTYASLEGFWQMMKYPESTSDIRYQVDGVTWPYTRDEVAQLVSFDAKAAGDVGSTAMKKLNIDWVTYNGKQMTYRTMEKGEHYHLIVKATWAKIEQNPQVKAVLLKTGHLILRPDHKDELYPAWMYYQIYMDIRKQLQEEQAKNVH